MIRLNELYSIKEYYPHSIKGYNAVITHTSCETELLALPEYNTRWLTAEIECWKCKHKFDNSVIPKANFIAESLK